MTTSLDVSSTQEYSSLIEIALASMSANFQELIDYQNGIDIDQQKIAEDQEQIDAQVTVQDTHYDADGNVYYTSHQENANSDTQIQIYQNDINMREANQAALQANYDDSSNALQDLASTLITLLLLTADKNKTSQNGVNDMKTIMQNLREITQAMNDRSFLALLSSKPNHMDEQIGVPSSPDKEMPHVTIFEEHPILRSFHLSSSLENKAFVYPELGQIEKILQPILTLDLPRPQEFGSLIEKGRDSIVMNPDLSIKEKQIAFVSLFKWVHEMTKDRDVIIPKDSIGLKSPQESVASPNLDPALNLPESIRVLASALVLELPRLLREEGHLEMAPVAILGAQVSSKNKIFDSAPPHLPAQAIAKAAPLIEKSVVSAALTVTAHVKEIPLSLSPKTPALLQENPVFQAAYEGIRFIVERAVNVVPMAKPIFESGSSEENEAQLAPSQLDRMVQDLVQRAETAALKMAAALIVIGKLEIPQSIEPSSKKISENLPEITRQFPHPAQPIQNKNHSPFGSLSQSSDDGTNRLDSTNVQPVIQHPNFSMHALIRTGTYAQLAVEGVFSSLLKGSNLFNLSNPAPNASSNATFSGLDAALRIGDGPNRMSVNSLSSEIVKDQKQKVSMRENAAESEGEEEFRGSSDSILAV